MKFQWMEKQKEKGEGTGFSDGDIIGFDGYELVTREDDRGYLSEICRRDWDEVSSLVKNFQQVYLVGNWEKGTIRAYHKHKELVDFFIIVNGVARFVGFDDRPDSATFGYLNTIIASARNLKMITVPAGVYHGWQSLEENTILVSVANNLYMGENRTEWLDEHRIPYDTFGKHMWEVEYK